MQFTNKKIGELVAEDYRTADVFKKFGIDFCCGGGVTVSDICRKKNISESEVIDSLIKAVAGKDSGGVSDAKNWNPGFLADYIVRVHHSYVKESLPVLKEYSAKVEKVHGQGHEYLFRVNALVSEVNEDLIPHMMKEETILFPLIHTLEKTTFDSESRFKMPVENPIHVMEFEHEEVGNLFKELREITNGFTPPEYACNTWRVLYAKLNEFEEDLFTHIHLENNILFPKAIQLEKNKGETAFQ